jgi:hypothetical protein
VSTSRFLSRIATFFAFVLFVLALPFLVVGVFIWGGNVSGAGADDIWLIKMGATILGPFSTVLWFIVFSHLVLHRRAGYFMQAVVFFGTAAAIFLLLINKVYRL